MANYATLKAAIAAAINQNGNNEITGNLLQQQLLAMVNSLGAGYQFAGVATPSTDPGTPDQNVFYIANIVGEYSNFNSISVDGLCVLKYNGTWTKERIFDYDPATEIQKFGLMLSLYSIQTTTWYAPDAPGGGAHQRMYHYVIPVKEGDKIDFTAPAGYMYGAYLTDYKMPVYGETPSFVPGYVGRQLIYAPGGVGTLTIPAGTKYMIINNTGNTPFTTLSVNGVPVERGLFVAATTIQENVNTLSEALQTLTGIAVTDGDLGLTIVSKNIANPANIQVGKLIDNAGNIGSNASWDMIMIPVTPGQIITFGGFYLGRGGYYGFYNNDEKVSFSGFQDPKGTANPTTLTIPDGVNRLYIDIKSGSSPANPYQYLRANVGSVLASYDEFEQRISTINGIKLVGGADTSGLETLIADLPVSDGADILSGYAYIETSTRNVKVKA